MGTRVYIGRLGHGIREKDIERFFKSYGRLRDVMLKNGYGFVEFEDHRDADDAVYEMNGKELAGERVIVEHARGGPRGDDRRYSYGRDYQPRRRGGGGGGGGGGRDKYGPPTRTENRLIVENLSSRVSWQDLKDYMRQAGEITYADAHRQKKNEGVVEFATYKDLKNAMDRLDGTEINGRKIRLMEDKPRRRKRSSSPNSSSSWDYKRLRNRHDDTDDDSDDDDSDTPYSRSVFSYCNDNDSLSSSSSSSVYSRGVSRTPMRRPQSSGQAYAEYRHSYVNSSLIGRSYSHSRSPSRSRSRSRSRRRSRSGSRSASRSRSRSRSSRSRSKSQSKSPDQKSRSRSKSPSKSRSRSPPGEDDDNN